MQQSKREINDVLNLQEAHGRKTKSLESALASKEAIKFKHTVVQSNITPTQLYKSKTLMTQAKAYPLGLQTAFQSTASHLYGGGGVAWIDSQSL